MTIQLYTSEQVEALEKILLDLPQNDLFHTGASKDGFNAHRAAKKMLLWMIRRSDGLKEQFAVDTWISDKPYVRTAHELCMREAGFLVKDFINQGPHTSRHAFELHRRGLGNLPFETKVDAFYRKRPLINYDILEIGYFPDPHEERRIKKLTDMDLHEVGSMPVEEKATPLPLEL